MAVFAAAPVLGFACASDPEPRAPTRECGLVVWHKPRSAEAHVEIVGAWNGWARPGTTPIARDDGWRVAHVDVAPGEHAYAIVEDGVWTADHHTPMTTTVDDREVSLAVVPDCHVPLLRVDEVEATVDGRSIVRASFLAAAGGPGLNASSVTATSEDGSTRTPTWVHAGRGELAFELSGLARGKHVLTLRARDERGAPANEAIATVWIAPERWEPRDAVVYQIFLDRFRNASGALDAPARPSDRAGGTLAGVRREIESGMIEALGVDTLWLSPLYRNPTGDFLGNDGRPYTSYHGYWPIHSRAIDERFATEAELDDFMRFAHSRGLRVLFDVVPNHVHEQHPWKTEHSGWFSEDCLCGQGSCDWGTHIRTCWFTSYLPDLDWFNVDAAKAATNEVLWWFERWNADGIRIDAVPMMPRAATRRIANAIRTRYAHRGNVPYIIGENFTGPGGFQSLRYDLGPHGLDGSFHFPLMWTIRQAIATESAPMSEIETTFRAGETAWEGSGAVMGLMIGNHDVSRFASVSAGNADGDTWTPPPQPLDPIVYAKQRVALAAVLTLPGAPVVYYGDEVGLAGRSDPDCRRVMPADSALLPAQQSLRETVRRIGRTRACSRALRRGSLISILSDTERFVFARDLPATNGESASRAIVVLTRRPTLPLEVALPAGSPAALVDVVTGARADVRSGLLEVPNDPFAVRIYLDDGDACATLP